MPNKSSNQVVIKKVKKQQHKHHGGSWKIAYADFVTAMMAFFLLMWLLASLNKAQKDGLADYFKQPLKIALIGGDSMGARTKTIQGGGQDMKKKDGQVATGNQGQQNVEAKQLQQLKADIMTAIAKDPVLADLQKQLLIDEVSEGLRIQLIDNKNKPMFDIGSDEIDPNLLQILAKIATIINGVPNKISIQGHTDAHPYHNPEDLTQSNWELSTQRANTARRALIKFGMSEDKVVQITGYASTVLLDKKNPLNPGNRRITIIVMKKDAEAKLIQGN
ncbi:flagellar motor protein MotB [Legionella jordanis]|uniref:Flagellar motor protein MotB n=1 Tax=Legionella jordanis TaxID=456 RepID=A0A0W0VF08_9GAMM|nr:flagellar motor protein MotB [Legionella jordanis]KTD18390.1 flagellar motor protein MotB [Legionella jordanis]RMX05298.1 motility protein MotB [Legionella jordanis]RMX20851.1 motility protein MotB [Legionella jordanis]VEH13264.1 chemotaxis protein MotB [Legionella jordanis]HAT8713614.1 flagellar motor protein MotB [Legionella jordanis]